MQCVKTMNFQVQSEDVTNITAALRNTQSLVRAGLRETLNEWWSTAARQEKPSEVPAL